MNEVNERKSSCLHHRKKSKRKKGKKESTAKLVGEEKDKRQAENCSETLQTLSKIFPHHDKQVFLLKLKYLLYYLNLFASLY